MLSFRSASPLFNSIDRSPNLIPSSRGCVVVNTSPILFPIATFPSRHRALPSPISPSYESGWLLIPPLFSPSHRKNTTMTPQLLLSLLPLLHPRPLHNPRTRMTGIVEPLPYEVDCDICLFLIGQFCCSVDICCCVLLANFVVVLISVFF